MTEDMRETLDAIEGLAHALKMDLTGARLRYPDWIKFNEHLNELKQWVSAIDDYKGCRHGHDDAPANLGLFGYSVDHMATRRGH